MQREQIQFDMLFVGAGPAGLAGAIRAAQKAEEKGMAPEIGLIEKGAEIGAHALSGAVLNPKALAELIPDYKERGCPIESTVRGDGFYYLMKNRAVKVPVVPEHMHNKGFYVVSLSKFTRWLGRIAEEMGINIFPGFAGKEILYGPEGNSVVGVRTDDKGLDKEGNPKPNFEPGIDIMAGVTILGEGARGSLTREVVQRLGLDKGRLPQVYETGIKEVIQLPEENFFKKSRENDIHTLGYPLGLDTPGGGFIYEMADNRISIGLLVGLSYEDPMIDLYDEFLRFKSHPFVAKIIEGGKVIESGARTVATGGEYTLPALAAEGLMLIGGGAGMQNPPALKGVHLSMKSGMLAAEAAVDAVEKGDFSERRLRSYRDSFEKSWAKPEIHEGRNFAQALAGKGPAKFFHLGLQYVTKGKGLIDPLPLEADFLTLKPVKGIPEPSERPETDGTLFVDKLTGVYLSKTQHREDQPGHLIVHDRHICVTRCYDLYKSPCTRFCPGQVYEMEIDEQSKERKLKLNPSNCLHCKTCEIKDPFENITWTSPEGGEGPGYTVV